MIIACVIVGALGMVLAFLVMADAGEKKVEQHGVALGLFYGAATFWALALGALWVGIWAK